LITDDLPRWWRGRFCRKGLWRVHPLRRGDQVVLNTPKAKQHGDYASNIALTSKSDRAERQPGYCERVVRHIPQRIR